MTKTPKRVPINLWDDYYDDGCVPKGEHQETHMYVEEYDYFDDDMKTEVMRLVLAHLKTLDLTGVEVEDGGSEIYFKHLTHERREKLMEELEASGLKYKDIPIDFYSES